MRYKPFLRALGLLLIGEAFLLIPPTLISFIYRDGDYGAFLVTIILLIAAGLPLVLTIDSKIRDLYPREGFAVAGLGWIILSLFGMLPFIFSGVITSPVNAFFETVSGFTTTGASILTAVEGLPHGILFWRSFTHWVGGMGILVLSIALLPQLNFRNMELLRAESPGLKPEKFVPKIKETARMLYGIYLGLTIILFLLLLIFKMEPFDAIVNTFGAAGTGGFSVLNTSIGGYNNPACEIILCIFMILFGVNFTFYFLLLIRQWRKAAKLQEVQLYFGIIIVSIIVITSDILSRCQNVGEALRYSSFQVASIITTTGYGTTDFNAWPTLSKTILVLLMLIGACAGSTGGGIKVVRTLLAGKAIKREISSLLHPRQVQNITLNGKTIDEFTLRSALIFIVAYFLIIGISSMLISIDGFDLITTVTAVIATISNIGPGLELVGPMGNYSQFSDLSKIVLSICMLIGRLEVLPILLLASPTAWRKL